jgi:phosphodiesterase/alkaline phosphatase D-like protein
MNGCLSMSRRTYCAAGAAAIAMMFAACGAEKSSNPLTPTVQGPIPGVAITAPALVQPINGARVRSDQQYALEIGNAATSGVRPIWYVFEVSTSSDFSSMAYTSGHVTPGEGGKTVLSMSSGLPSDRRYYWRARAEDGANTGPNSATTDFQLFTPAVFQAPTPLEPINDNTVSSLRPTFKFRNADRTGSPDTVNYTIEVSESAAFSVNASATVTEQPGQTTIQTPQDLPFGKTVFWRVRAFDSISMGPWSAVASFKTSPASVPGSPGCSYPGHPSTWSTELWHDCFFSLIDKRGVGPTVSDSAVWALRADLLSMGAA